MSKKEEEYKKQLKESGVDVEDLDDEDTEDEEEDNEDEEDSEDESDEEEDEDEDESEEEDEEDKSEDDDSEEDEDEEDSEEEEDSSKKKKKPSIYDEYKKKKKESKQKDQTIAELKSKLEAFENADEDDKEDAMDDLEAFAKEINANPEVIKKMKSLFNKGQDINPSLKKDLLEFKEFKSKHEKEIALVAYNEEFKTNLPFVKELFPKASEKEVDAIKEAVEKMVHSKGEWNNKSLDFVMFRNKDKLSKLISPKKKGMETRERHEGDKDFDEDFDPNADISEMSASQFKVWEKKYNSTMKKGSGLSKDGKGKKLII